MGKHTYVQSLELAGQILGHRLVDGDDARALSAVEGALREVTGSRSALLVRQGRDGTSCYLPAREGARPQGKGTWIAEAVRSGSPTALGAEEAASLAPWLPGSDGTTGVVVPLPAAGLPAVFVLVGFPEEPGDLDMGALVPLLDCAGRLLGAGATGTSDGATEGAVPSVARLAQELREARRLVQTLLETIPFATWVKDAELRYLMVNQTYRDFFGLPDHEIVGRRAEDLNLFKGQAAEEVRKQDGPLFEGRAVHFRGPQTLPAADGRVLHQDVHKTALLDDEGKFAGLVGVAVDVTSLRVAQEREALALSRLRGAINSLPAVLMLFDQQERLVLWNQRPMAGIPQLSPGLREGMTYEEIARLTASSYVDEEEMEANVQAKLAEFRTGRAQGLRQMKDGRWIQYSDFRTEDGGTVSMRYDVTNEKRREGELQHAYRMEAVGQLTGGVAHDFNNLLTVMLGNVELLRRYVPPVGKPAQLIDRTLAAGQRGAALTQRLLSFSRRQALQAHAVSLNDLVRNMRELLDRALGESTEMMVELAPDLWMTRIDAAQMENALLNLTLNARDAMPDGGSLTIRTENAVLDEAYAHAHDALAGEYVLISVTDTGTGVPPELVEKVFEPFFTTKEVGRGSGLGLSMVYGFVRQSKGHVRLDSPPNEGATVRMYLPRAVEDGG